MAITRSTASHRWPGYPPLPGAFQILERSAVVRRRTVIHAPIPPTTQAPNRSSHRRTTRMGPPRARAVHATATTASQAS